MIMRRLTTKAKGRGGALRGALVGALVAGGLAACGGPAEEAAVSGDSAEMTELRAAVAAELATLRAERSALAEELEAFAAWESGALAAWESGALAAWDAAEAAEDTLVDWELAVDAAEDVALGAAQPVAHAPTAIESVQGSLAPVHGAGDLSADEVWEDEAAFEGMDYAAELGADAEWFEHAEWGMVARPTNAAWEPYMDGYWDDGADGLVWVGATRFDRVTSLYGTWEWYGGWVWVPDGRRNAARVVWVAGDVYVGWAPASRFGGASRATAWRYMRGEGLGRRNARVYAVTPAVVASSGDRVRPMPAGRRPETTRYRPAATQEARAERPERAEGQGARAERRERGEAATPRPEARPRGEAGGRATSQEDRRTAARGEARPTRTSPPTTEARQARAERRETTETRRSAPQPRETVSRALVPAAAAETPPTPAPRVATPTPAPAARVIAPAPTPAARVTETRPTPAPRVTAPAPTPAPRVAAPTQTGTSADALAIGPSDRAGQRPESPASEAISGLEPSFTTR